MRYLFTTFPATSHMMALVPLAHAAHGAGHDVLVASSGKALEAAAAAGLDAVAADEDGASARAYEDLLRKVTDPDADISEAFFLDYIVPGFGDIGVHMADGLVEVAKRWGADAVVYPEGQPVGLLAAQAIGVPAVLHGVGTPRRSPQEVVDYLVPLAQRLGVAEPADADVELDVSPPSLDRPYEPPSVGITLPMRYGAYSGGAQLPRWLFQRGSRPRVVATLGSFVPGYGEVEGRALREVVLGTADLGIELIMTIGPFELPQLPSPLPEHVTPVDWTPLRALLATCDGIIHHGGQNTMHTSLHAGVPQLVLPLIGEDAVDTGRIVAARGAGSMLDMADLTADSVRAAVDDLLSTPSYRDVSREVAQEMRAMPDPSTVIGQLTEIVGRGARV